MIMIKKRVWYFIVGILVTDRTKRGESLSQEDDVSLTLILIVL